jgi:hypothetical protein
MSDRVKRQKDPAVDTGRVGGGSNERSGTDPAPVLAHSALFPDHCWWYCSFVEPDRPEGDQFIGAVLVYGSGGPDMLMTLGSLNLNPGGEVAMVPVPVPPPKEYRGRLLSRADIEDWDARESGIRG